MKKLILGIIIGIMAIAAAPASAELVYISEGSWWALWQTSDVLPTGIGISASGKLIITSGVKIKHSFSIGYITDGRWCLIYQRNKIFDTNASIGLGITSQNNVMVLAGYEF